MLNNTVALLIMVLGQASGSADSGLNMSLNLPDMDLPVLSADANPSAPSAKPAALDAPAIKPQPSKTNDKKPMDKKPTDKKSASLPLSADPGRSAKPTTSPNRNDKMIPAPVSRNQKTPSQTPSVPMSSSGPTAINSSSRIGASAPVAGFNDPLLSANYLDSKPVGSASGNMELYDQSLRADQGKGHIMPLDQVEIPAQEAGTLTKIYVREGLLVEKGQTLAQIEDDQVKMAQEVQRCKLLAAEKEASNDVNIRYSKAASAVADAEVLQAKETNARVPGAVPSSEVRRLELALIQTKLQIEQAEHQYEVAKITVDVQQAEYEAAVLGVKRREVIAPIAGVVVEKYRNEGEWVRPGDSILKVIYLERLRAKTTLDINKILPDQVINHKASVELSEIPGKQFPGRVVFVNPVIQPGGSYEVWVEVDNEVGAKGFWLMQPGMNATITILPEEAANEK